MISVSIIPQKAKYVGYLAEKNTCWQNFMFHDKKEKSKACFYQVLTVATARQAKTGKQFRANILSPLSLPPSCPPHDPSPL